MTTLTYEDVIHEHQRLDIDFDQTVATIRSLFPDRIRDAIELWNIYEAYKLGWQRGVESLHNNDAAVAA